MSNFVAIAFSLAISLISVSNALNIVDANNVRAKINDRIFGIIDDLFLSLNINHTLIKAKSQKEYTAMHKFIQDKLSQNNAKYKEVLNKIEINMNNKTADQISGVNEVIVEMIKEQARNNNSIRNEYVPFFQINDFDDLSNLAKGHHLNSKTLTPNDLTMSVSGPNGSREVDARRIFAGAVTTISRYPFMVSVHLAGHFVCAGSLLQENFAISAASCLMRSREEPNLQVQIRVASDYITKQGYLVNIDRMIFNPDFDSTTLANNLVMLKTRKPLKFQKKKITAIKYDKWDATLNFQKDVKDIVILGWGRRGALEDTNAEDRPLSRARLNVYDLEECKFIYTSEYISTKNFCAGFVDRGEGACNHDGGGPALAGSFLAGVISFGSPRCGQIDAPTVFTRLSLYGYWIDSVLESSVPKAKNGIVSSHVSMETLTSGEIDTEELNQNPRDILAKEFGLKDILHGPVDARSNMTLKPTSEAYAHVASEQQYLRNGSSLILKTPMDIRTDSPLGYSTDSTMDMSADNPIHMSIDNTKDLPTETPVDLSNDTPVDMSSDTPMDASSDTPMDASSDTPMDASSDTPMDASTDTMSIKNILTDDQEPNEDAETLQLDIAQIDLSDDLEGTTMPKSEGESMVGQKNEKVDDTKSGEVVKNLITIIEDQLNIDSKEGDVVDSNSEITAKTQFTSELPPTQSVDDRSNRFSTQLNEFNNEFKPSIRRPSNSLEQPQYDVQYKIEIKSFHEKRDDNAEGSVLIISESGTTERVEVNDANNLQYKLKNGIKELIDNMNRDNARSGRFEKEENMFREESYS